MALSVVAKINLDMQTPNAEIVYGEQYDSADYVNAQLLNDGEKWTVPNGAIAFVSYMKSDRIGGYYDTTELGETAVSINGSDRSLITIALDQQVMSTRGRVNVQVTFIQNDKRLSTFSFLVQVNQSVFNSSNLASKWFGQLLLLNGLAVDNTLTIAGAAADAKEIGKIISNLNDYVNGEVDTLTTFVTNQILLVNQDVNGFKETVNGNLATLNTELSQLISTESSRAIAEENKKVNKPLTNPNGTSGQLLRTNGDGSTEWVSQGLPTDAQTEEAINAWLNLHPEATTTVQDGALTKEKFSEQLKLETLKDYVTPQMFGAKADGVTDDSEAIALAEASDAETIFFPAGTYLVNHLTATKSWIMDGNAWITTEQVGDTLIHIPVDNKTFKLNLDLTDKSPKWAIDVLGNENHFEQIIINGMKYLGADDMSVICGVVVRGNRNTFDFIKLLDLVQAAPGNDSAPQGVAVIRQATDNYFAEIYGYNCRSTIVVSAEKGTKNGIGVVRAFNAKDNGVYLVAGGHLDIGEIYYDGDDEILCVITDGATSESPASAMSSINVGAIMSPRCYHAIRFDNAYYINVDSIQVGNCENILFLNTNNYKIGSINIGRISAYGKQIRPIYLSANRGDVYTLHIDDIYIHDLHETTDGISGYFDLSAIKDSFYIGAYTLIFESIDDSIGSGSGVYHKLPGSILNTSYIGYLKFENQNGLRMRWRGFPLKNLKIKNGLFTNDTNCDVDVQNNTGYDDALYSRLIPSYGTWDAGQVLKPAHPNKISAGISQYICLESGTPGKWIETGGWIIKRENYSVPCTTAVDDGGYAGSIELSEQSNFPTFYSELYAVAIQARGAGKPYPAFAAIQHDSTNRLLRVWNQVSTTVTVQVMYIYR